MINIYDFTDYHLWLKQRTAEIKLEKPYFSYRFIAAKLILNPGFVAKILNSKNHLSLKRVDRMAQIFGLKEKEKEYFSVLVRFGRAKNQEDINKYFLRLQTLRGMKYRTVADGTQQFYQKWYHMALRTLLSIHSFPVGKVHTLGKKLQPSISVEETRQSLNLLEELKLIKKSTNQTWEVTDKYISTGEKWQARDILNYQKNMIEMSAEALDRHPKNKRDISSLTLPFSMNQLETLRERLAEFRQEVIQLSQECEPADSVFQLNLQLFPLGYLSNNDGKS